MKHGMKNHIFGPSIPLLVSSYAGTQVYFLLKIRQVNGNAVTMEATYPKQ
jgi:hypothetical protein